ncbi:MAG: hypothetical protein PHT69_12775 [Bacteroidales bacterium]|nr:hypothetical protein [Bacteroidales bacterium]
MKPEEIFRKLYDSLPMLDKELLAQLMSKKNISESSKLFTELFKNSITTYKTDDLEFLLSEILKIEPKLAQVNFPANHLFRLAVISGSFDLYRGFIKYGIEPFLKDKSIDEKQDYFFELNMVAQKISDDLFPKYNQVFKGMHYNSAFARHETNPDILLIMPEDNDVYEDCL